MSHDLLWSFAASIHQDWAQSSDSDMQKALQRFSADKVAIHWSPLMEAATVRSKGRLTIPAKVRQALALHAGDRVEFVELERGEFLLVAANRSLTDLKGIFGKPTKAVSIEEMNRGVAAGGSLGP